MSQATAIEWTDVSWNPVLGCSIKSTECRNCYAETIATKFGLTPLPWTPANAAENVILKPHKLREPFSNAKHWRGLGAAAERAGMKRGKLVFVNSMSDLFHEQIPDEYIGQVLNQIFWAGYHRGHVFQVLTKRPERMRDCMRRYYSPGGLDGTGNPSVRQLPGGPSVIPWLWLGVSIGLRNFVRRADVLRQVPAAVRFISAEPLLGPLVFDAREGTPRDLVHMHRSVRRVWLDGHAGPELDLTGIDWLIAGGESGAGHRRMDSDWVRDLRQACAESGTAFFFKQWGGARPGGARELDGREWSQFPGVGDAELAA